MHATFVINEIVVNVVGEMSNDDKDGDLLIFNI